LLGKIRNKAVIVLLNNLLGKIRNKAVIVLLIIDGAVDKERLSGTLSVRTVSCLCACLVASLVTVPRVLPAINKLAVWPYYFIVMD